MTSGLGAFTFGYEGKSGRLTQMKSFDPIMVGSRGNVSPRPPSSPLRKAKRGNLLSRE